MITPSTKNYRTLHKQVIARAGAVERLASLRADTLAEIGLYELRRALHRSQAELAEQLGVSQSAISQIERGEDIKLSTLRNYVEGLGGELRVHAIFDVGNNETSVTIQLGAA
jgi:DNA-binding XRE family transcriptional regulator